MVKRLFVVTGPPGVGKTTLIKNVCDMLKSANLPVQGFFTEELRENGVRSGFDVVTLTGKRSPLARVSSSSKKHPSVGKYTVDVASFELTALPLFTEDPAVIKVLDEIGKMELFSTKFEEKVTDMLQLREVVILATIPVAKGAPVPLLTAIRSHPDTELFEVSRANRDALAAQIFQQIKKLKI